jgi:hypothetical protein
MVPKDQSHLPAPNEILYKPPANWQSQHLKQHQRGYDWQIIQNDNCIQRSQNHGDFHPRHRPQWGRLGATLHIKKVHLLEKRRKVWHKKWCDTVRPHGQANQVPIGANCQGPDWLLDFSPERENPQCVSGGQGPRFRGAENTHRRVLPDQDPFLHHLQNLFRDEVHRAVHDTDRNGNSEALG